jgi:hypothetical protein
MSTLACPTCGNNTFSDFTVTEGSGDEIGKERALSFAVGQGDGHILVSISCDICEFRTSNTIIRQ